MSQHTPAFNGKHDPDEELSTISYRAVSPGLPVVTHSGEQFGVVEHVLQVPELDLCDGVVVYTGTGRRLCRRRVAGRGVTGGAVTGR